MQRFDKPASLVINRTINKSINSPMPLMSAQLLPNTHWCDANNRSRNISIFKEYQIASPLAAVSVDLNMFCHNLLVPTKLQESNQSNTWFDLPFPLFFLFLMHFQIPFYLCINEAIYIKINVQIFKHTHMMQLLWSRSPIIFLIFSKKTFLVICILLVFILGSTDIPGLRSVWGFDTRRTPTPVRHVLDTSYRCPIF